MKKTSLWATFGFLCLVFGMLALVMWLAPSAPVEVAGLRVRFPSLASITTVADTTAKISVEEQLALMEQEAQMNPASQTSARSVLEAAATAADSARIMLTDSLAFYERFFANSQSSIALPDSAFAYLFPFFRSLERADHELVHVMHYGDSQIEGDRITRLLRDSLQARFGGSGPGLLPLMQPIGRLGVRQSLAGSVECFYGGGMMGARAAHNRYGALAQFAVMDGPDTLRMEVVSTTQRNAFRRVTLYAAGHGTASADGTVSVEGGADTLAVSLNGQAATLAPAAGGFYTASWSGSRLSSADLRLCGRADILGVAFDAGHGVSVTNNPMRGSDGTFISRCDQALMGGMLRHMNTRMVILEYGGNALPYLKGKGNVDSWVGSFGRQIECVRRMCPAAVVLVIGPADMSVNDEETGELASHPMLPYLTSQMRELCREKGVAFWDMYAVMGGHNSMLSWVGHQPAWAAPDYVHFTTRGAEKIAAILWTSLRMNYEYMLLLRERDSIK